MAGTRTLTSHEEIRDWAAARSGYPAIINPAPSAAYTDPVLAIVFGQHAYEDQDRPERPDSTGSPEMVEWDEWFRLFDERQLAMVVGEDVPGRRDQFHEIIRRDSVEG